MTDGMRPLMDEGCVGEGGGSCPYCCISCSIDALFGLPDRYAHAESFVIGQVMMIVQMSKK